MYLFACQSGGGNEVDDVIRDLKKVPGFSAYAILNNDGIVIKYENMSYKTAVYHAHQVLSLSVKASKYIGDLFEHPDVRTLLPILVSMLGNSCIYYLSIFHRMK